MKGTWRECLPAKPKAGLLNQTRISLSQVCRLVSFLKYLLWIWMTWIGQDISYPFIYIIYRYDIGTLGLTTLIYSAYFSGFYILCVVWYSKHAVLITKKCSFELLDFFVFLSWHLKETSSKHFLTKVSSSVQLMKDTLSYIFFRAFNSLVVLLLFWT